ncbi:MAG TPA: hypothetical protein DE060_00590 [Lentisphaeria bacterium]|nr:hypothetical protein [Lentisphaeria bacterium]HCG47686.1 hypothetical protein [Lentisphaeria bacterium]
MKKFDIFGEIWQMSDYYYEKHMLSQNGDYPMPEPDGYPVPYPMRGIFERSKEEGLFSAFRIGGDFWPRDFKLKALDPDQQRIQIDMLRGTTDYKRPENAELQLSYEDFAEHYCNAAIDFALAHPGRVMLCAVGEIDSSHPWPKDHCFRTRKEAYEFFKYNCFHTKVGSCDPDTLYRHLKKRGLSPEQVNLMMHGACLFAIPYFFEWGFPHIEIERGLGTSLNMQVSLAYLRGAWKQFGRKARWGIDFSTHQPNYNQCCWYDENGTRLGGFTESMTLRCWMSAWMGGADYLLCEGSDYTHWVFQKDGSFGLSALGEAAKKFAGFTLRSGIDRGEPVVPGAVMLDYYNGYEQEYGVSLMRPYVWGNCLPCTNTDLNISCVLDAFFPGQREVSAHTEHVRHPECGYSTRQEYLKLLKKKTDMRYLEKGVLTPTPAGDSIDVVWDTAPPEVLREYKVLIPAGAAVLPDSVLDEYVAQGGTLAVGMEKLTPEMEQKLGIQKEKPLGSDWDYDRLALTDGSFFSDGLRYGFTRMKFPSETKILAVNSRNIPVVAEIPYGSGKVLLCTVPLGQDVSGSALLGVWSHILQNEVKKHLPVEFDSRGILEIAVNRKENGGLTLALFNSTGESWQGGILFREPVSSVREVFPQECSLASVGNRITETLEPYSVKILTTENS